mmetsp:Transcript_31692/g.73509  ORF Transcript_31692/g.73509 Transcript_31692/m.73509 type:complete len:221 (+) Transcript_31692:690-1352(+)
MREVDVARGPGDVPHLIGCAETAVDRNVPHARFNVFLDARLQTNSKQDYRVGHAHRERRRSLLCGRRLRRHQHAAAPATALLASGRPAVTAPACTAAGMPARCVALRGPSPLRSAPAGGFAWCVQPGVCGCCCLCRNCLGRYCLGHYCQLWCCCSCLGHATCCNRAALLQLQPRLQARLQGSSQHSSLAPSTLAVQAILLASPLAVVGALGLGQDRLRKP